MVTQVPKMLALVGLYFLRHLPCVYGNDSLEMEEIDAWRLSPDYFYDVRCEEYIIKNKIGSGSFGVVYEIKNTKSGRDAVAKISLAGPRTNTLDHENRVLRLLSKKDTYFKQAVGEIDFIENVRFRNDNRILTKIQYAIEYSETHFDILIMNYMGVSLDKKSQQCGNNKGKSIFKAEIIDLLAVQYLYEIETIHAAGILHLDIKPGNTMFQGGQISLIDFGSSLSWKSETGFIDEYCLDKRGIEDLPRGTPMYKPYAVMRHHESPKLKHDLESILITLLDFENILPDHTSKKYNGIGDDIEKILKGREELRQFVCDDTNTLRYGKYCNFFLEINKMRDSDTSEPNYEGLRELFRKKDKKEEGFCNCFSRGARNLNGNWC